MERTISAKRQYSLGPYKSVEFFDSITGIPEELMLNDELVSNLRRLQYLKFDKEIREYLKLQETLSGMDIETSLKYIEEQQLAIQELLNKLLDKE